MFKLLFAVVWTLLFNLYYCTIRKYVPPSLLRRQAGGGHMHTSFFLMEYSELRMNVLPSNKVHTHRTKFRMFVRARCLEQDGEIRT